jgi:hypothetical protein
MKGWEEEAKVKTRIGLVGVLLLLARGVALAASWLEDIPFRPALTAATAFEAASALGFIISARKVQVAASSNVDGRSLDGWWKKIGVGGLGWGGVGVVSMLTPQRMPLAEGIAWGGERGV